MIPSRFESGHEWAKTRRTFDLNVQEPRAWSCSAPGDACSEVTKRTWTYRGTYYVSVAIQTKIRVRGQVSPPIVEVSDESCTSEDSSRQEVRCESS